MKLFVGTSGYSYKEWKGSFYPEDLAAKDMLGYYSSRLAAVEINNTFYRMPERTMLENWQSQVPKGFRFSLKAPQRITHFKRLNDVEEQTKLFFDTATVLNDALGVVLFQLPPNMKKDHPRLEAFLQTLPANVRTAFEFRHASWFDDSIFALLHEHNRAFCVSDTDEIPATKIDSTADWGYLRLRRVKYGKTELTKWMKQIRTQTWSDVFVFFKHEDEATGPKLAAKFLKLAEK